MSALWTLEGLTARVGGRRVLDGVSLSCAPGEVIGVLGPNGAGKTSLLRAGLGLIGRDAGRVELGGEPIERLSPPARAARVGYLPQERRLGWNLAAWRVAALGAPNLPERTARPRALAALERVGMAALAERGVLDMSGGERARVLLARLLVTQAPLLVADEPIAGLDPDSQHLTLDLFRQAAQLGAGVVITLHDLGLAGRACGRVVVLNQGRIVADGGPMDALNSSVLADVFHLDGAWVQGPQGPLLSARRRA